MIMAIVFAWRGRGRPGNALITLVALLLLVQGVPFRVVESLTGLGISGFTLLASTLLLVVWALVVVAGLSQNGRLMAKGSPNSELLGSRRGEGES